MGGSSGHLLSRRSESSWPSHPAAWCAPPGCAPQGSTATRLPRDWEPHECLSTRTARELTSSSHTQGPGGGAWPASHGREGATRMWVTPEGGGQRGQASQSVGGRLRQSPRAGSWRAPRLTWVWAAQCCHCGHLLSCALMLCTLLCEAVLLGEASGREAGCPRPCPGPGSPVTQTGQRAGIPSWQPGRVSPHDRFQLGLCPALGGTGAPGQPAGH